MLNSLILRVSSTSAVSCFGYLCMDNCQIIIANYLVIAGLSSAQIRLHRYTLFFALQPIGVSIANLVLYSLFLALVGILSVLSVLVYLHVLVNLFLYEVSIIEFFLFITSLAC